MKHYPSLEYFGDYLGTPTIGFEKLDGSNLRFEYSQKRGFYKFGSKKMMIDENTEVFGKGIKIFLDKYADELTKIFKSKTYRDTLSFVCFAEFIGKKSEFGRHVEGDKYDMVLFDVDQYKKGFVKPKQFVKDFGHLHIPKILYQGNINKELYNMVKTNTLTAHEGELWEGLVCKSEIPKGPYIYYCKLKTQLWLDTLKAKYNEEEVQE